MRERVCGEGRGVATGGIGGGLCTGPTPEGPAECPPLRLGPEAGSPGAKSGACAVVTFRPPAPVPMLRRALLAAVLALAACDSTPETAIGGTYVFEEAAGPDNLGVATEATLAIPETGTGEGFSFSYTFQRTDGATGATLQSDAGTGTGTYDHPAVTFRLGGETAAGTVSAGGGRIVIAATGFAYVRQE